MDSLWEYVSMSCSKKYIIWCAIINNDKNNHQCYQAYHNKQFNFSEERCVNVIESDKWMPWDKKQMDRESHFMKRWDVKDIYRASWFNMYCTHLIHWLAMLELVHYDEGEWFYPKSVIVLLIRCKLINDDKLEICLRSLFLVLFLVNHSISINSLLIMWMKGFGGIFSLWLGNWGS